MNTVHLTTCLIFSVLVGTVIPSPVNADADRDYATFEEVYALADDLTVLLIDVRQPGELEDTGSIPGSINIPLNTLPATLVDVTAAEFQAQFNRDQPQLDTPIIFICRSGARSAAAQNTAWELGFTNVRNFRGGWLYWEERINQL